MSRHDGDINAVITATLQDLAAIQASKPKQWAYKRAAAAVAALDVQLSDLVAQRGSLPPIPYVGPSSRRVVDEILAAGRSETVEQAIDASGRRPEVELRRTLRAGVLSRAEVVRVLQRPMRGVVTPGDYRGDLQMHSEWSDGSQTIAALAAGAAARGYEFIAVTDHSRGLPIAGGVSPEKLRAQQREIDAVNRARPTTCRVLKGLETNILADGTLDVSREECGGVELVLAAPHAKLRSSENQTARMLRALDTPWVHVLAHPRGRMAGSRPGVLADWDRVFERAAARGVAVEIDGDPHRQDLDHTLAARALDAGCVFALDSDAHHTDEFVYAETAMAHARLARIPASRIINCWPLQRLLGWLQR